MTDPPRQNEAKLTQSLATNEFFQDEPNDHGEALRLDEPDEFTRLITDPKRTQSFFQLACFILEGEGDKTNPNFCG